jgi:iron(III) transport system permease protein
MSVARHSALPNSEQAAGRRLLAFLDNCDAWQILMVGVASAVGILILLHIGVVFWVSFLENSIVDVEYHFGWANYVTAFTNPFALEVIFNTLGFSVVALVVALAFGIPIAWLITRTDLPGRALISLAMTLTILVPGYTSAMGWLFLAHPRIGLINKLAQAVFGLDGPLLNITSIAGMGWVQGLHLAPVAFIMTVAIFRAIDPSLEEAAAMSGGAPLSTLRQITMRLAWPGILAASIYIFVIAFAALDTPAIIGWGNRVFTFGTYMLDLVSGRGGLPQYGTVAALAAPMVLWAATMTFWYYRVQKRARQYQVVTGKAYRPNLLKIGNAKWIAWGYIGFYLALNVVLPILVLGWASLLPILLPPSAQTLSLASLANYRNLDWDTTLDALGNTLVLAVATATCVTVISFAFSWIVLRSRLSGRALFEFLGFAPHVIPNTLFSIAALLIVLFVVEDFLPLYGSLWVLIIVMVIVRISYGTRMTNGALMQIHSDLDESAHMCGATTGGVIRRVLLPLLAPALLYTWLWTALLTCRELAVLLFLTTAHNLTVPYLIWSNMEGAQGMSAVLALMMIVIMIPFVTLYVLAMDRKKLIAS